MSLLSRTRQSKIYTKCMPRACKALFVMAIFFRSVRAYADAEAFDRMDSDFRNDNRVDTDYYFRAYARNSDFDDDRIGSSDGDSRRDDDAEAFDRMDSDFRNDNRAYARNSDFDDDRLGSSDGDSRRDDDERDDLRPVLRPVLNPRYRENYTSGHVDDSRLGLPPVCPNQENQEHTSAVTIGNTVISGIKLCHCPPGSYFDGNCAITELGTCLYFLPSNIPSGHCRHGIAKHDELGLGSKEVHDSSSAGNSGPSIKNASPIIKTTTKNYSFFDDPIVLYIGGAVASIVFVGLVVSTVMKYRRNRKVSTQARIRKLFAEMEKSDHVVAASFLQESDGDDSGDDGSFRSSYINWKSLPPSFASNSAPPSFASSV